MSSLTDNQKLSGPYLPLPPSPHLNPAMQVTAVNRGITIYPTSSGGYVLFDGTPANGGSLDNLFERATVAENADKLCDAIRVLLVNRRIT